MRKQKVDNGRGDTEVESERNKKFEEKKKKKN